MVLSDLARSPDSEHGVDVVSRRAAVMTEEARLVFAGEGLDLPAVAPGSFLAGLPRPVTRVALVRAARIGDFLCAIPAIRALRAALPEAEFTFIGLPFVRDLVERSPYLDRFLEFPGFPGLAEQFFEPRQALAFFADCQAQAFDLAIQMHGSGVYSNPFTLMLGARAAAGFTRPDDAPGRLAAALPFPDNGHESARLLALAIHLGAPNLGLEPEFPLWDEDRRRAGELLAGASGLLIGVHPGAREITKRWPPENLAAAATELARGQPGEPPAGTVVIVGGPDEVTLADEVAAHLAQPVDGQQPFGREQRTCLNLAGRTSLGELGAVIERLAVLITNDSGPAHVAYALGTPTVTVFGSTSPERWGPPQGQQFRAITNPVPCWPCDRWECPVGLLCLKGITVERVVQAAREVMWQPNDRNHEA